MKCKYTRISLLWWIKGRGYASVGWNHYLQIWKSQLCRGLWSKRMAPQSCNGQNMVLKSYKGESTLPPKRGKIKNILHTSGLYQFVFMHELIYYPCFFSSHFIPSEECLEYPMTILPDYLLKQQYQRGNTKPLIRHWNWHFSRVRERRRKRKWIRADTPCHFNKLGDCVFFPLSILY